eukprot:2301799-Prymnesium_polylepis.1
MRTFKSERAESSSSPASVKIYRCPKCPRTFPTAGGLTLHQLTHAAGVQPKGFFKEEPAAPQPAPAGI